MLHNFYLAERVYVFWCFVTQFIYADALQMLCCCSFDPSFCLMTHSLFSDLCITGSCAFGLSSRLPVGWEWSCRICFPDNGNAPIEGKWLTMNTEPLQSSKAALERVRGPLSTVIIQWTGFITYIWIFSVYD